MKGIIFSVFMALAVCAYASSPVPQDNNKKSYKLDATSQATQQTARLSAKSDSAKIAKKKNKAKKAVKSGVDSVKTVVSKVKSK